MKKSDKTRKKILESTINLVAEKGYAATSTKEIAKNAGISEATIFKYYENKNNLLMTIVEQTIDELYDYSINQALPEVFRNNEGKPISSLLYDLLLERFTYFSDNSKRLQVIFQEMMVNRVVRDYFKEKVWKKLDQISKQIIKQGKKEGVFKDIDPYFIQKAIFGMLFYTNIFEKLFDLNVKRYNSQKQVEMILEILFIGIKK